jgi:hypothetical protein
VLVTFFSKAFQYFDGTKIIKKNFLKEMRNYDVLSLLMGGMFGKTLAVFAAPPTIFSLHMVTSVSREWWEYNRV